MQCFRTRVSWFLATLIILLCSITAQANSSTSSSKSASDTHTVVSGQTLGGIAKRYKITIEELCVANNIKRSSRIRPGQKLVIPGARGQQPPEASRGVSDEVLPHDLPIDLHRLDIHGKPPVYYFEPTGSSNSVLRPVIMALHGRGGNAAMFCSRWSQVARPLGWLVCPSAPHPHGAGESWRNDWFTGKVVVDAALKALRERYPTRVQLYGNTLLGFSEGAFVAMNVGIRDPRTYNRWLILAANDAYWGANATQLLNRAKPRLHRVFLITGQLDGVYDATLRTYNKLQHARVQVNLADPPGIGHEIALDSQRQVYKEALSWLQQ